MTANEISREIRVGNFTNEELNAIVMSVKFARAMLVSNTKATLRVGGNATFTSIKLGRTVSGTVTKINRKFVIVREGMTNWRVPASMLTAA